jgi:ribose transport system ATP-binding protein
VVNGKNMSDEFLKMENISKAFPGTLALDDVSFNMKKGEIRGLIGENGAGKSTLVNIISGAIRKDSGKIFIDGKEVYINHPSDAKKMGIVAIHQELNLFLNMNIAENIFMGNEKVIGKLFLNRKETYSESVKILQSLGMDIKPNAITEDLPVAQMQMIEIARALVINAKLIVMDEPTSSLTGDEINKLVKIINNLKSKGVSIIFVTHKLEEVVNYTDSVTVLRDGKVIGTLERKQYSFDKLIKMMVGKEISDFYVKRKKKKTGEISLELKNLSTEFLKNINFSIRRGEILGFAGPVGSGRTEVMRAIFGIDKKVSGDFFVYGKKVTINSPSDAIREGIGLVPEDRKLQGLILSMMVKANITLPILRKVCRFGFLDYKNESKIAENFIDKLAIKVYSKNQILKNLSGGNQQKVVISKWLAIKPKILLLDEPTRGIDVGTKQEIYNIISKLSKEGISILLISSELEETLKISDRIIVLYEGEIKGEIMSRDATQEKVLKIAHK